MTINHNWQQISLCGDYRVPIIFAGIPTMNGHHPAAPRLRNLERQCGGTTWAFEIRLQVRDPAGGARFSSRTCSPLC